MQNAAAAFLALILDHGTGKSFAIGFFADNKKLAREHAEHLTRDAFPAGRVTKVVRHSDMDPASMGVFTAIKDQHMPVSILPAPTAPEGTAPVALAARKFATLGELDAFEQASRAEGDEQRAVIAARGTGQLLADIAESYRRPFESLRAARKRIETYLESGDRVLTSRECAEAVMVWMKEAAGLPSSTKVKQVQRVVPEPKPVAAIEVAPNPSAQHAFKAALTHMGAKPPEQGFACYDDAACAVIEAFGVSRRKEYAAGRKAGEAAASEELERTRRNLEESRKANTDLRAALAEATDDDGEPDQKGAPKPWRLLANERKVTADLRQELAALRNSPGGTVPTPAATHAFNKLQQALGTGHDDTFSSYDAAISAVLGAIDNTRTRDAARGSNLLAKHELTIRAYEQVLSDVAKALEDVRPHLGGPERLRDAADTAIRRADAWRHGPIVDIIREQPDGVVAAAMQCLTSALATHRALKEAKLPLAQGATRG